MNTTDNNQSYCPLCGTQLQSDMHFCKNCGAKVGLDDYTLPTAPTAPNPQDPRYKNQHTASMVLAIVGCVFAFISPIVTYVCCGLGLTKANQLAKMQMPNAKFVKYMCIVGIILAACNHFYSMFYWAKQLL